MEENRLAAHRGLSFIPNAAAVREMLSAAGFSRVEPVAPPADGNPQYLAQDRAVFLAFK